VANVNSIRCCGFDKAYKALTNSRKGCLCDKELYGTALLSYQIDALASYSSEVCLTQQQYDNLFQKLSLGCGCCKSDVSLPDYETTERTFCLYSFIISDDTDFLDWTIDGLPIDSDNVRDIVMPSYGGFGNVFVSPIQSTLNIGYIGDGNTPAPTPVILDKNGDPITITWKPCCTFGCRAAYFPSGTFISSIISGYTGLEMYTIPPQYAFDPTDPDSIDYWQVALSNVYGPQFQLTAVYNPLTFSYLVTFDNVFVCDDIIFRGEDRTGGPVQIKLDSINCK